MEHIEPTGIRDEAELRLTNGFQKKLIEDAGIGEEEWIIKYSAHFAELLDADPGLKARIQAEEGNAMFRKEIQERLDQMLPEGTVH